MPLQREAKYPKEMDCLDVRPMFYDYTAEHWMRLRTKNPLKSTLAMVRQRTRPKGGCGSRMAMLMEVFKLA